MICQVYSSQCSQKVENTQNIGSLVSEVYRNEDNGGYPCIPLGCVLEDTLTVMDFYGFPIGDAERIHAKLQLKELDLVGKAKDFVVAELDQNPGRQTMFLIASHLHDMDYINKGKINPRRVGEYNGERRRFYLPDKFVRLSGNSPECTDHVVWAEDPCLRSYFLAKLKEALPSFGFELLNTSFVDERLCSYYNLPPPKKDFCWAETEGESPCGDPPVVEEMVVLHTLIPFSISPNKRIRAS